MDVTAEEILVAGGDSVTATRRSSRPVKPTAKAQNFWQVASSQTGTSKNAGTKQVAAGDNDWDNADQGLQTVDGAARSDSSLLQMMLQTTLQTMLQETSSHLMSKQKQMLERLWDALVENQQKATKVISDQLEMIRQLQQEIRTVRAEAADDRKKAEETRSMQEQTAREMKQMREQLIEQLRQVREQAAEETKQLREQLDAMAKSIQANSAQTSPHPSYADVARTPPSSQPSNVQTLSSMQTTPSTLIDTLFCTIDTSRVNEEEKGKAQVGGIRQAIEEEMRKKEGRQDWRCAAVVRNAKNADRIKVICRDESEMKLVKEAAEKTAVKGARVLRDQLYPVKVDGANRAAVLDSAGNVLPGTAEALGKENGVTIAKMHWLSDKENGKSYGSMVIYVTKASDAQHLLEEKYFHLAGESASTN
ncbi:hypothetical protein BGZ61DRAFT_570766, partial [Ilyonectria robusta]|uniref:uncharacterized protein n=1 Tax=Ilyonectria robusta TaxID=1079257 RepID=UPI001E8E9CE8